MDKKKVNPLHIESLMSLVNKSPYFSLLGIRLVDISPGYAKVTIISRKMQVSPPLMFRLPTLLWQRKAN